MSYKLNQIVTVVDDVLPDGLAKWCNENACYIEEIEANKAGERRFKIVAVPAPTLDEIRAAKLTELTNTHEAWREKDAYFVSSLGFKADGKTATVDDISLLWSMADLIGAEYTATFVDYDNVPHQLSYSQVKQLYIEEGLARQAGYSEKWKLRAEIEAAETVSEIEAVEIKFTPADFVNS